MVFCIDSLASSRDCGCASLPKPLQAHAAKRHTGFTRLAAEKGNLSEIFSFRILLDLRWIRCFEAYLLNLAQNISPCHLAQSNGGGCVL